MGEKLKNLQHLTLKNSAKGSVKLRAMRQDVRVKKYFRKTVAVTMSTRTA